MLNYFLHDRRETGNGAGAQIIAVRETTRQHNKIATLQIVVFVPQLYNFLVHGLAQHVYHILIAIGTRENYNSKFHGAKVTKFQLFLILRGTFSAFLPAGIYLTSHKAEGSGKKCIFTC